MFAPSRLTLLAIVAALAWPATASAQGNLPPCDPSVDPEFVVPLPGGKLPLDRRARVPVRFHRGLEYYNEADAATIRVTVQPKPGARLALAFTNRALDAASPEDDDPELVADEDDRAVGYFPMRIRRGEGPAIVTVSYREEVNSRPACARVVRSEVRGSGVAPLARMRRVDSHEGEVEFELRSLSCFRTRPLPLVFEVRGVGGKTRLRVADQCAPHFKSVRKRLYRLRADDEGQVFFTARGRGPVRRAHKWRLIAGGRVVDRGTITARAVGNGKFTYAATHNGRRR